MTFSEKLERARNGSKAAYESLCLDITDELYTTALISLKSDTAAKKSVSSAIMEGYRGISKIKDEKHLRSWLVHELTKNIVDTLKEYKASGVTRTLPGIFGVTSALPDVERLVFAISASFGYGKHEISLLTGMSENAVGDKLDSAMNRLGPDYAPLTAAAAAYRAPEDLKDRYRGFDESAAEEEKPEPEAEAAEAELVTEEPDTVETESEPVEETAEEKPENEESAEEEPENEKSESEQIEETTEEESAHEETGTEQTEETAGSAKVFADESAADKAVPDEESAMDEFPENGDESNSPLPLNAKTFIAVVSAEKLKGSEFLRLIGNTRISNSAYREIEKNPHLTRERLITLLEESPLTEADYYKMLTAVKQRREILKAKEKIEAAHERAGLFSGTPRERPARRRLREEHKPQKSELQLAIEKEMHSESTAPAPVGVPERTEPPRPPEAYSPLIRIPDEEPAPLPETTAAEPRKPFVPEKTEAPALTEPRRTYTKEERRSRTAALSKEPESLSDIIGTRSGMPHKRGESDIFRSAEIALKTDTEAAGEAVDPFAAIYARDIGFESTPAKPAFHGSKQTEPDEKTPEPGPDTGSIASTQQLEMPFPKLGSSDMQEHPFAVMSTPGPTRSAEPEKPVFTGDFRADSKPELSVDAKTPAKKNASLSVTQILDDFSYTEDHRGYDMSVTQILEGLDNKNEGLNESASSTYGIKAPIWTGAGKETPDTQLFTSAATEENDKAAQPEQSAEGVSAPVFEVGDKPESVPDVPLTIKEHTGPVYIPDFTDSYLHIDDDSDDIVTDDEEDADSDETDEISASDGRFADDEEPEMPAFEVHYADEDDGNDAETPEPEQIVSEDAEEEVLPFEVHYADDEDDNEPAAEEADTTEAEEYEEETDTSVPFVVHFADEEPAAAEEETAPDAEEIIAENTETVEETVTGETEAEAPAVQEPDVPVTRKAPMRFTPGEIHDTVQFEVSGEKHEEEPAAPAEPETPETGEQPFTPGETVSASMPAAREEPEEPFEPEEPRKRYKGNEHFVDDDEYVEGINNGKMIFCAVCAVLLIGGACAMKFLPKQDKPAADPAVPVSASAASEPQTTEIAAPAVTVPTESKDILAAFASYDEITAAGENVPAAAYDIKYMNASARPYTPTLTKRYLQTANIAYIYNEGTVRMVSLDPAAPVELGTVTLKTREGSEFLGFTVLDGVIYAVSQTGAGTASAKVWTDIFDGGFAIEPYSLDGTFADICIVAGKPVIVTHAQVNGTAVPHSSTADAPAPVDIVRLAGSEFAGFTVIGEIGGTGLLDIYGGNATFVNSDGGLTILAADNNRTYAVDITADLKAENARVFAGEAFSGDCLNGKAFIGADRNGGIIAAMGDNASTTGVEGEKPESLAWASDASTAYVLAAQNSSSVMLYGFDMSGEEPASTPAPTSAFYGEKLIAAGSGLAGLAAECDESGDRTGLKLSLYSYSGALKETASTVIGLDEKTDADNLKYLASDAETDPAFISVSENGDIIAVPTVYFDGFSEVVRIVTFSGSSLRQTGELMLYETKSPYVCTAIRQGTLFVMIDGKVMTADATDCSNIQTVESLAASMGDNAGWLE